MTKAYHATKEPKKKPAMTMKERRTAKKHKHETTDLLSDIKP